MVITKLKHQAPSATSIGTSKLRHASFQERIRNAWTKNAIAATAAKAIGGSRKYGPFLLQGAWWIVMAAPATVLRTERPKRARPIRAIRVSRGAGESSVMAKRLGVARPYSGS